MTYPTHLAAIIAVIVFFACVGTARVAVFVVNHVVFGRKHETIYLKRLLFLLPALFVALVVLLVPFVRSLQHEEFTNAGIAGAVWVLTSAAIGLYWIVDRIWQNHKSRTIDGVRIGEPEVIRIRKAHIPFRSLQRIGAHNDLYDLEVTSHEVVVSDLAGAFDGYTIAFVSDTHVTSFMRRDYYRGIVEKIAQRKPDLVLLGGDYVSFHRHIPLAAELLLAGLSAPDGVLAVLGNHDYWADADEVTSTFSARGVVFVQNRVVEILRGDARLVVAGIDEVYRGEPDVDLLRGISSDQPRVVLSHHPDIVDQLRDERVDLLLCGHTHGGQIRFPILGSVIVPSAHESKYDSGFFRVGRTLMYVGRGIGAVPPVRILCRPELPFFTLRSAMRSGDDRR